jgi:hypothetical protein
MSDMLSIKPSNQEIDLETNKSDYYALLTKRFGTIGAALTSAGLTGPAAPLISSILGEVISLVIPGQKMERVVIFLKVLADRLKYLEEDFDKEKLKNEWFTDLLEDAVLQSSRALTQERKEYIADLLKKSLTDDELDHLGKKKLLSLLNELNDAEIILLYYYSLDTEELKETLRSRYPFLPKKTTSRDERWRSEDPNQQMYSAYRGKIMSLDLLYLPGTDYRTTNLGNTLLRYIGLRS